MAAAVVVGVVAGAEEEAGTTVGVEAAVGATVVVGGVGVGGTVVGMTGGVIGAALLAAARGDFLRSIVLFVVR